MKKVIINNANNNTNLIIPTSIKGSNTTITLASQATKWSTAKVILYARISNAYSWIPIRQGYNVNDILTFSFNRFVIIQLPFGCELGYEIIDADQNTQNITICIIY